MCSYVGVLVVLLKRVARECSRKELKKGTQITGICKTKLETEGESERQAETDL